MHAAKGTPERAAYEKKLALMKEAMSTKSFFLPSLGRTDMSIKFHNRMQIASKTFVIDCSDFGCETFFEELWWIGALVSLNFTHNLITAIPPDINMLQNLTIAKLNHNQLVTIPVEMCAMTRLQRLFLHNNCIESLPSQISQLTGLLTLTIEENPIQRLPFRFGYLPLRSGYDIGFQIFRCDPSRFIEPPEQVMSLGSDPAIQFLKKFAEVEDGLESFSLQKWQLHEWPISFGQPFMHHITLLDVSHNAFTSWHPAILLHMVQLVTLNLSFNKISVIPLEITSLVQLRNMFLEGNPITILPAAVAYIKCLEQYSIDFDKLIAPSKVILELGPFKVLEYLRELNAAVGKTLNMANRIMTRFPIEVCTIDHLRGLDLSNNTIGIIPDEVETLANCLTFDCSFNQIEHVSSRISKMEQLEELKMTNNNLVHAGCIFMCPQLSKLTLDMNNIEECGPYLGEMSQLQSLSLNKNKIAIIDESVGMLVTLVSLFVSDNVLSSLPDTFSKLISLKTFNGTRNRFNIFPRILCWTISLQRLLLKSNQFTVLDDGFGNLTSLVDLDIEGCPVTEIPTSFSLLPKLRSATVWDAFRFLIPSQIIVAEGMAAIQSYLGKLYTSQSSNSLNLSSLKLKAFPIELLRADFSLMDTLCLDDNPITEIPRNMSQLLKRLVILSVKNCSLRECSTEFGNLMHLKELYLDFNTDIVRILWQIFDLPELEHLGWIGLNLLSPPAVIMAGNVSAARHWIGLIRTCTANGFLDLRNMNLEIFPEDMFKVAESLHQLFLEGNLFDEIPATFEVFRAIELLDMQKTLWKPFELHISSCIKITKLIVNDCSLTQVSLYLLKLVGLQHLNLSFNNIGHLPVDICHLTSLRELLLHNNPTLRTIPISIGQLTALNHLNLSKCSIGSSLPHTLSCLTNLDFLDITDNCITHLPPSFGHLSFVANLFIDEHCLLYPHRHLVEEGRYRWMEYLRVMDVNSVIIDDTVDLSYWKLPVWPLDLFGLSDLKILLLNGNMIMDIPSKHEIPKWLQIELESKKFEGLVDECESDSTIDSKSDDLLSEQTESEDSMLDNDFGSGTKKFQSHSERDTRSDSSDDDKDTVVDETNEEGLHCDPIGDDTQDLPSAQRSVKIKPKIARLAATLEAHFSIRNGGITYWHAKQSVQMLPFPDISMLRKLVHLEISGNDIEKIPAGLLFLTSITHLDVSFNRIDELTWGLAALKNLTNLNVLGNPIELLPRALVNLTKLQILEFDLDGRIVAPHIMIQNEGLKAMREFWIVIQKGLASGAFDFSRLPLPEFPLEFTIYKYGHINTPCKRLMLRQNNLQSLDAFAPQYMQELQFLDCSQNVLQTLPHFIKDLKCLEEIIMDHNEILRFPWQLGWAHNLRKLSFDHNLVDQLPTSMYLLSGLTSISANHNRFEILPRNLKQFPVIAEIFFARNRIRLIPDAFVPGNCLKTLDLSDNNLTRVSLALLQATSIQHLKLHGNPIRSLPFGIHDLVERLSTFSFDWSKITFPPKAIVSQGTATIDRFQKQCVSSVETRILLLNNFQLDQIPQLFNKLQNTTHLDVSGNTLMFFTLTRLVELKYLNATKNQFSTLPVEIGGMVSLMELNLSSNKLNFLPASFSKLLQLTVLNISRNKLVEFPECFTRLTNLTILKAALNMIRSVPEDIGGKNIGSLFDEFQYGMLALQELDFSANKITAIPDSFKVLSSLRSVDFTANKIFECPSNFKQCSNLVDMKIDWQYLTDLKPLRLDQYLSTYINGVSCPVECVRAGIPKMKEFFAKIIDCIKSAEIDLSEYNFFKFPTDMKCIDFLQKLSIKLNKFEVIPKVFEQYQDLIALDLSNNRIKLLPSSLSVLTGLESLDVSNNLLESLPCELCNIPEMRRFLSLGEVGLTDVVAFKWAGNNMTLYDPPKEIVGYGFEQLPMILRYLKHIFAARRTKVVTIVNVPLTRFPRTWVENDSSWAKVALTHLQISGTKIQELPDTISRMTNLKKLNLTCNFLEVLPESIGTIHSLESIDVSMNPMFDIPIAQLKNLHVNMNLTVFICLETFIPSRPTNGRPSIFLADYFDYLQKIDSAAKTGKYTWSDIELLEISEDIYYWPMKSMRSIDHPCHRSLQTPVRIDFSIAICLQDPDCVLESCSLRHPQKRGMDPFVDPIKVNAWSDNRFKVKLVELRVPGTGMSKVWLLPRLLDLTIFDASGNMLRSLPTAVSKLTNLTELMLDRNAITTLPHEFGGMLSLKNVSMSSNQLKQCPDSVNSLTNLKHLNLSRNFLRTFPIISALSELVQLVLNRNILVELPSAVFSGLESLVYLDLSYNALNDLPASIGCLKKLEICILNSNALQFIPKSFANLPRVSHLALGKNMINLIPSQLRGMANSLKHFRINDNSILKVPIWIKVMKCLTEIFMDGITISHIPDTFFEVSTLTTVSAERNQLDELNPNVGKLSNLTHLSLSTNVIREIPLTLFTCTKLVHLALDSNNLTVLQRFVSRLEALKELWLHRNMLTALPRSMCLLSNLSVLSLAFNEWKGGFFPQITSTLVSLKSLWLSEDQTRPYLPIWIKSCSNIVDLNIDFSVRKKPPFHVLKQGIEVIFKWILQISKGSVSLDMDVSRFSLNSIPWFEVCRTLRRLDISRNNIVTFYTDMQLPNLIELICNNNRIVEFTSAILNCPSLRVILAWNNRLTTLSLPICSLPKLQRLELQRNQISSIPDDIGRLVALVYLDLTSNQLHTMPTSMYQMTSLQSIEFQGNKLDSYLGPVAKQGVSIFLKYMESCFHVEMTESIHLGNHGLETCPIHLCQQTSVTDLSLFKNNVSKIPSEICWLTNLTKLSVRENKLKTLPDSLSKCKVEKLDIGANAFEAMPKCLANLFSLNHFIADNNLFADLDDAFQHCCQVSLVNLDNNFVAKIPTSWKNLFGLKSLSLRFNSIGDVGGIRQMTQIESLFLEGNTNLTQLDIDIGSLTSLKELYAMNCNITKVSGAILQCKKLKSVNLSGNKLSFLPDHFFSLKCIEYLILDDNRFSPIPDLHRLQSLIVVSFSNNPIAILPAEFGLLVKLTDVTFSQCLVKNLPHHLANLMYLERFAMPMNELVAIPESICECHCLRKLEFQHNKLENLPLGMTKLTKLTDLFLHRNIFENIPAVLFDCQSLKTITLHNCSLFVKKVPHKLDLEMLRDLEELITVEKLMHKRDEL